MSQTIQVPTELFQKFLRAGEALSEFHDTFEDYLITTNPALLRKLRRSRRDHLAGKTRSFDDLKREMKLS